MPKNLIENNNFPFMFAGSHKPWHVTGVVIKNPCICIHKLCTSSVPFSKKGAVVDLPAPSGPAITMI